MNEWKMLPAGRELDRIVAERRGLKVYVDTELMWIDAIRDFEYVYYMDEEGYPQEIPAYSTDANTALSLVEKCGHFSVGTYLAFGKQEAKWEAVITEGTVAEHIHYEGHADTPALSIVRVWLAYVT